MKPIRRLAFYGVSNKEQWIEKCIEGVTGESKIVRQIISLAPLMFNLAIGMRGLDIATKNLKAVGVLK